MNRRSVIRALAACFSSGAPLTLCTFTGATSDGSQQQPTESLQLTRRVGNVPSKARPESLLRPMEPTERIRMVLSFWLRHEGRLLRLIDQLNDPASPLYHQ